MKRILTFALCLLVLTGAVAKTKKQKVDKNFYVYLCIGQSNMEAGARPAEQDKGPVDPRFQMLAAVDMPRLERKMGEWYDANPPICRQENNMGPVDFFGRAMVESLPKKCRVGVINVSVAGADIILWDSEKCEQYLSTAQDWMKGIASQYGSNPYQRLVEMARIAQQSGLIKGLLIHQGETNSTDPEWPNKVLKIRNDLIRDLGLKEKDLPVLAGELKSAEEGGVCAGFNSTILPNLPKVVPNAFIISSKDCKGVPDQFHFNTEGFRKLGTRYAVKMLEYQGYKYKGDPEIIK